jgi:tetratricopeptide (TPR) repeat protein
LWGHAQAAAAEVRAYPECTTEAAESDVAAAKGAFQAGQASFNEADYERAITYWEDAFRRDCTASALLLNLARAYELNGNRKQAVEALETYLARNPEAAQKDKTQITRRIEVLNRQIEAQEKEQAPAAAPPPTTQPAQQAGTQSAAPPAPTTPTDQQAADDSYWIGPAILGGAGVVAAAVGPFIWLNGNSDEDEAAKRCPTRRDCPKAVEQLGNDGIFKEKLGAGLFFGGLAAMGGAAVWLVLTMPDAAPATSAAPATEGAQPRTLLVPVLTDGYSGVSLVGTF